MDEMKELQYFKVYDWWRCPHCNKIYPNDLMKYFDECEYQPQFRFCPNCSQPVIRSEENKERARKGGKKRDRYSG